MSQTEGVNVDGWQKFRGFKGITKAVIVAQTQKRYKTTERMTTVMAKKVIADDYLRIVAE